MALEALNRAGRNPQLKGVVHELLCRDRLNLDPRNLLTGTRAHLTNSANAVRDDVILKQASRVVGRMQLKDTAGSIRATVRQMAKGKYARTALYGTKETTAAYAAEVSRQAERGVRATQVMRSTGVSSADTARVASKALGQLPGRAALAAAVRKTGLAGAGIVAAAEAVSAFGDLRDGRISGSEFAGRVAREGLKGGVAAASATAASSVATAGAATVCAVLAPATPVLLPLAIGVGVSVVVGSAVKRALDRLLG